MESELLFTTRQSDRSCVFEVEGLADTFWVVRFSGSEALSSLFEFHIEVVSRHVEVGGLVGRFGRLRITQLAEPRIVHGMILRTEYAGDLSPRSLYRLTFVPWIYKLLMRTDCRVFQDQNTPDIVAQVLTQAGLPRRWFRFDLQSSYTRRDYCVQYRESDLQFVCRLLEEDGMFYYFEHEEMRHQLVMTDRAGGAATIAGDPELPFRVPGGMATASEHVSHFRTSEELRPERVTLRDFNLHTPEKPLESTLGAKRSPALELYDYPAEYQTAALGQALARQELAAAQATRRLGAGDCDCPRLTPGLAFTLVDHPRMELDGDYCVVAVHHVGDQPNTVDPSATPEMMYRNEFTCIERRQPFRSPRVTPRPAVRGVQTATVVGPPGQEIHVDAQGRVKVQFHWDRRDVYDESSSCWVRVSQQWAGNGFGAMFIPRVGHEVIVDFIEGDPDRPIVTGRIFHGTNAPPYALPDEMTKSTIKSESSPGGGGFNELRFEDQKGSEQVFVHAQRDLDLCVRNDRRESVRNDDHATIHRDRFESVGRDSHTTIAGKAVAQVAGDASIDARGALNLAISGAAAVRVDGGAQWTIAGGQKLAVEGDHHTRTTGNSEHAVMGSAAVDAVGPVHVHGAMVVIEADTGITLKVGGSFITLDASGISISGTQLRLNSGGAALSGAKAAPQAPDAPKLTAPIKPSPAEGDS